MAAPDVAARVAGGRRGIEPEDQTNSSVARGPRRAADGAGSPDQRVGPPRLAAKAMAVAAAAFGWACVLVRAWTLLWDIPLDSRADGFLRWSYGAMKGRPQADRQQRVAQQGTVASLPVLVALGFQGLWFDTFGYADPGDEAVAVQAAVGVAPLRSTDGRFLFFDLRPYAQVLHLTPAQALTTAVQGVGIAPPCAVGASS